MNIWEIMGLLKATIRFLKGTMTARYLDPYGFMGRL